MCADVHKAHLRILDMVDFYFHEFVFVRDNAGKDMWLWAQTANVKLKQDAQTAQDADGMLAMSLLYVTQLEAISQ